MIVSISTVTALSFWYDILVLPKDASAIPCVVVGLRFSLAAISAKMNERCAPSLNSIFASLRVSPAMTGATAVFSKQVVLLWGRLFPDVEVAVAVTGMDRTSVDVLL